MQATDHNSEAERAVLGAVLIEPEVLHELTDTITSEDFYKPEHGLVWKAIECIMMDSGRPDLLSVTNALRIGGGLRSVGGAAGLSSLVDSLPDVSGAVHYAEIVKEFSLRRQLVALTTRSGHAKTSDDAIEKLQGGLDSIAEGSTAKSTVDIADVADRVARRARALSQGEAQILGFKSGFSGIDRLLTTLHPGRLLILAARPAMGKTTLACNIGMNVAKAGGGVLFVSLEMSRNELTERMLATEAEVDTRSFQSGKFNLDGAPNDIEMVEDAAKVFRTRAITIDDRSGMTAVQLRSLVRKTKSLGRLDLVIVDYLQLMSGPGRNNNDIYGEISRSMKCITKDLDVPILALSQLSRSPESEGRLDRPRLSDLRDSGRLEQDADQVMFITRDEQESPRIAQLQLAKNRQGPMGDVPLRFNPNISQFTDGDWADFAEEE